LNPETRRNAAIIALVGVTVSFMLYFAAYKSRQAKNAAIVQNLIGGKDVSGQQAPDFELKKVDGSGTVKLSDYRGRAVMINFWATWCGPCKIEMPWFIDLKKKYADQGFEILGVAMENTDPPEIKAFADKMGVNYVVLKGKEEMYAKYGDFEGLPTTFFIDKNGVITAEYQGLHSKSDFEDRIRESLAGYSASNHSEHK
jgi:cytochrome c biogenesis protein CcmG/thiol:disulfide interchange protein DsbE